MDVFRHAPKIIGTDGKDIIHLVRHVSSGSHGGSDGGNDTINAGNGNNEARGDDGNDTIVTGTGRDSIEGGKGNDLVLAGTGNDTVRGGDCNDVLVGGEGDDSLTGDDGRDVMIGGLGTDTIIGSKDEDLLIAGWTSFDSNQAALNEIMAEWGSTSSYANRVSHLSGASGGLNGATFLRGSDVTGGVGNQTVFDSNADDRLTGSQGTDWFMANTVLDGSSVKDIITDLSNGENSSEIDLNVL